jgi:hypothetical protein
MTLYKIHLLLHHGLDCFLLYYKQGRIQAGPPPPSPPKMLCLHAYLHLQLPIQSMPITTNGSGKVNSMQHYVINLSAPCGRSVVSSTNYTDRQDITKILLKVALNIIPLTPKSH